MKGMMIKVVQLRFHCFSNNNNNNNNKFVFALVSELTAQLT